MTFLGLTGWGWGNEVVQYNFPPQKQTPNTMVNRLNFLNSRRGISGYFSSAYADQNPSATRHSSPTTIGPITCPDF